MKVTTVTNSEGRVFNVKRVDPGEWYGRKPQTGEPCLQADKTLVEFWDASHSSHGPLGQLVSRYYLDSLTHRGAGGLNLDGSVREWWIDADALSDALRELR